MEKELSNILLNFKYGHITSERAIIQIKQIIDNNQALQLQQTGVSGSALREKFFKETNIAPVFAQRTPYIQYIEFLEKELTR